MKKLSFVFFFFCHQLQLHSETTEVDSPPRTVAALCLFCLYTKAVVPLAQCTEVQLIVEFSSGYKSFRVCPCDSIVLK